MPSPPASPEPGLPTVTLQSAQFYVAKEPTRIVTLLGSCVAVCLHDRRRRMGAMCHGFLPRMREHSRAGECRRFVDCSIHRMVEALTEECGCSIRDIRAQVFGGARTFLAGDGEKGALYRVGLENIATAREVLRQYGLRVTFEEVGGVGGYKIFFDSHTGRVWWQPLRSKRGVFAAGGGGGQRNR